MTFSAVPAGRTYTADEFECLPGDGRWFHELSHGLLVREPRPGTEHARVAGRIFTLLLEQGERRGQGIVIGEGGFLLSSDPPTVRGPDVAFVSQQHVPDPLPRGFWPGAPDLAVEVASPSNSVADLQEKILEYFAAGTRLAWVVEPRTRTVVVYNSVRELILLRSGDALDAAPAIEGFVCRVSDLFE